MEASLIIRVILWSLTALTLVLGTLFSILNRKDFKKGVRIWGVCVFFLLLFSIYPHFYGQKHAVWLTVFESMGAMLLNSDPSEIMGSLEHFFPSAFLLFLYIVAPLFTVGITLSFFSERLTRLIYHIRSKFTDSYLFSAINERSLAIAEDIASTQKRACLVFAVCTSVDDINGEALARIKKIGAYIIDTDIVSVKHTLSHVRNYYLLDASGSINLETGLRLYEKYSQKQTDRVNLWLYTKEELSEVVFDHLYETFNIRLINEERLIAHRLMTEHPLYEGIQNGKLSVLLVGGGNIGLEILRNTAMCTAFAEGIQTEIHVVDQNGEKARAILEKTSPALAERFSIHFHSADVKASSFKKVLSSLSPTYIIVALGNETLNMETSLYIRRFYGIQNGMPLLHALVDHKSIEEHILPALCVSDWSFDKTEGKYVSTPISSFDIRTFGSYEETYRDLRIGARYLNCLSIAVNAVNKGIRETDAVNTPAKLRDLYNQVSFYKDYADAYAVSIPYKLYLMGLCFSPDGEADLSLLADAVANHLPDLRLHENRRFEAFMRGKGWEEMPLSAIKDGRISDKLSKKHARLTTEQDASLGALLCRDFAREDIENLQRLPDMIRLANALYGKGYSVKAR